MQTVKYTRNGRAYFFQTPHLGSTAAAAAMAALYIKANKDWYFVAENPALVKGTLKTFVHHLNQSMIPACTLPCFLLFRLVCKAKSR
jgi:hypothetical protein